MGICQLDKCFWRLAKTVNPETHNWTPSHWAITIDGICEEQMIAIEVDLLHSLDGEISRISRHLEGKYADGKSAIRK